MGHRRCPEDYSCPIIDEMLDRLYAIGQATILLEVDDGELTAHVLELQDKLEIVRGINHGLREWGCEEAHHVDVLQSAVRMMQGRPA